jgi:LacI family transcriptional regulator
VRETARPTLVTVAERAGVSIASVSRVINGLPATPDMVERVRTAADAVGYVPDAVARSLKAGRTGQLAFSVADVANPVYVAMMRAIERVTKRAGYRLLLSSTDSDPGGEVALLRSLRNRYVDGLILSPIRVTDEIVDELSGAARPVVVIGTLPDDVPVDNVRADSRHGVGLAIRHLIEAGRKDIALINGPTDTVPGAARIEGFERAMAEAGRPIDRGVMVEADDFTFAAGRVAADRLFADRRPDAIFAANDLLAIGVIRTLHERGLRVPEDVAVVGMDDTELAEMSTPALTSVSLASEERGELAARLLLERLNHPDAPPARASVPPRLVVRASSGPADGRAWTPNEQTGP